MSDAVAVATKFFDAHRAHDIYAMGEMCSPRATFDYVPFVGHDKQRVVHGKGYVNGVGRTIWALGFRAFGDLTNEVNDIWADAEGNVVADVTVSGTQSAPYLTLGPRGQSFTERHLFRLHIDADGRIDDVAAYYDAGSMNAQLGHVELD